MYEELEENGALRPNATRLSTACSSQEANRSLEIHSTQCTAVYVNRAQAHAQVKEKFIFERTEKITDYYDSDSKIDYALTRDLGHSARFSQCAAK